MERKLREGESEDFEQGQRARLYKKNVNEERDRDQRQDRGVLNAYTKILERQMHL
jgi:hypothetical protein